MTAIYDDLGSGHVGAGVRGQQQQRPIKVRHAAKTALGDALGVILEALNAG